MSESALIISAVSIVTFALIAKRLSASIITAPIFFLSVGYFLAFSFPDEASSDTRALHLLGEATLVLLLFTDAAQIRLRALRDDHAWPLRTLLLGIPLAVAIGTVAIYFIMPDWPIMASALLAALLTPTDAALGQTVVTNKQIPERIRRCLLVESGLNDGLALPIILFFACFSAAAMAPEHNNWFAFAGRQILFGPIVGVAVGAIGGRLFVAASNRGLTSDAYEGVGVLGLAASTYLLAELVGGNGFISAFVGGLSFGYFIKGGCNFVIEFAETEGQFLVWAVFLLIGYSLAPAALAELDLMTVAIILISLFIVRPLAIWLSLLGSDAKPVTRGFIGWFGPRGLATALFALLVVEEIVPIIGERILSIAVAAVIFSAILHGVSAMPAARRYARWVQTKPDATENTPCTSNALDMP